MKKIALIPSYEPDDKLKELVSHLSNYDFDIIVVNDGSNENYRDIFNSIKEMATVLEYPNNRGKGYALKHGLQYIKDHYTNFVVVTMDSDGQHSIQDAIKLCEYTITHPNELVLGKRIRSGKIPFRSRIGNGFTKAIYYLTTGVNIYDTQTGLRCFTNKIIDFALNVQGDRFEYEMNVLLYAPKEEIKITEIKIETIYIDNNSGSHFHALKDSYRIYKEIIKFSCSSVISFFVDYSLYSIFVLTIGNIVLSNIFARIISATVNYTINKKIVFHSHKKVSKTLVQYSILASFILLFNTLFLYVLVSLRISVFLAKIIVEIVLFLFSWFVQKNKIFKKETVI